MAIAGDSRPAVTQGAAARRELLRGAETMARLLRPTLGPSARTVLVEPIRPGEPIEVLDRGATIARRVYHLARRADDVGATLVRHIAWRVFREVGDGSATAAVLAARLLREAERGIAGGASPVGVRRGVECGLRTALVILRDQARPFDDPGALAGLMLGTLQDPTLAAMVAEVADSVGPDGAILIENAYGTRTEHEYVEGLRWDEGWLSASFEPPNGTTVELLDPRILVSEAAIESPEQLAAALEACVASGGRGLFVVAPEMSDAATALLLANRGRGGVEAVVAVRTPSVGATRLRIAEDIAVATGGRYLRPEAGDRFADLRPEDLGRARHAWATRSRFGIVGGQGTKAAIRARIAEAQTELREVGPDEVWLRGKIRERIGKLAGEAAVILAGAPTESAREELKTRLEAAVTTAQAALRGGAVVAGGGAALVACAARLEQEIGAQRSDAAAGQRALARSLTEPMAAIAENAGYEAGPILDEAIQRGPAWTFDARRGTWVEAHPTGLVDALAVLEMALTTAASGAASALTTGALVYRREPPTVTEP